MRCGECPVWAWKRASTVGRTPFDHRVPCDDYAGLHAAGDLCSVISAQLREQAARYAVYERVSLEIALLEAAEMREREEAESCRDSKLR